MTSELEALSARLDAVERELLNLARARFDACYPPGHAEREAKMPAMLRNRRQPAPPANPATTTPKQTPP